MTAKEFKQFFLTNIMNSNAVSEKTASHGFFLLGKQNASVPEENIDKLYTAIRYFLKDGGGSHTDEIISDLIHKTFVDNETFVFYELWGGENIDIVIDVPYGAKWDGFWLVAVDDETGKYLSAQDNPAFDYSYDDWSTYPEQYVRLDDFKQPGNSRLIKVRCQLEYGDVKANGNAGRVVYSFYVGIKNNADASISTATVPASADLTATQIKQAYEVNEDTNAFTNADKYKLETIESGAEVNQTFTNADKDKLDTIEYGEYEFITWTSTGGDVTNTDFADAQITNEDIPFNLSNSGEELSVSAEYVKTLYESNSDTNAYTYAEKSKLSGIETGAEVNQTSSEIKTAYEANSDTNAYTNSEKNKLQGIESGAEVNDADTVLSTDEEYEFMTWAMFGGDVSNTDFSTLLLTNEELILTLTNK